MRIQNFIDRLEFFCHERGIDVRRAHLGAHVLGRVQASTIVLRPGLNKEQQVLTLAHELTHVLVHYHACPRIDRTICEYEALTVERLLGAHLNLPHHPREAAEIAALTDDLLACSVARVRWVTTTLLHAVRAPPGEWGYVARFEGRHPDQDSAR